MCSRSAVVHKAVALLSGDATATTDNAAWASSRDTTSRPSPSPSTGKITVMVINHYGDEVLKVYEP